MSVLAVQSEFKTVVNITIKFDDNSSKTVSVKEDDQINVSYVIPDATVLSTVTGKVKNIIVGNNEIVVDASIQFESNVLYIDISSIRDISLVI